jgi:hypothetical protein
MLRGIKKALQHKDTNREPNVPAYTRQYYMLWLSGDPAHCGPKGGTVLEAVRTFLLSSLDQTPLPPPRANTPHF